MDVSLDELKEILIAFDRRVGSYPENEFEGATAYSVILRALRERYPDKNIPPFPDDEWNAALAGVV